MATSRKASVDVLVESFILNLQKGNLIASYYFFLFVIRASLHLLRYLVIFLLFVVASWLISLVVSEWSPVKSNSCSWVALRCVDNSWGYLLLLSLFFHIDFPQTIPSHPENGGQAVATERRRQVLRRLVVGFSQESLQSPRLRQQTSAVCSLCLRPMALEVIKEGIQAIEKAVSNSKKDEKNSSSGDDTSSSCCTPTTTTTTSTSSSSASSCTDCSCSTATTQPSASAAATSKSSGGCCTTRREAAINDNLHRMVCLACRHVITDCKRKELLPATVTKEAKLLLSSAQLKEKISDYLLDEEWVFRKPLLTLIYIYSTYVNQ